MAQYRILKFTKDSETFAYQNILTTYALVDGKPVTTKNVESPFNELNEQALCKGLSNLSKDDDFLFQNTLWSSFDRGSCLVFEPPGIKNIDLFLPGFSAQMYEYIHPSILYYITTSGDDRMYVAGIWYILNADNAYQVTAKTPLYHPYLPNVFRDGMVCTHNFYSGDFDKDTPINLKINMAIEDFWSSNFNDEVNDFIHHEAIKVFNPTNETYNEETQLHYTAEYSIEQSQRNFFTYLTEVIKTVRALYGSNQAEPFLKDVFYKILRSSFQYYSLGTVSELIIHNNPQTALYNNAMGGKSDIMNHYLMNDILKLTYENQI